MATEAQLRAIKKYDAAHYDNVNVKMPKGIKERIKAIDGISVNKFIIQAVLEKLQRMEQNN